MSDAEHLLALAEPSPNRSLHLDAHYRNHYSLFVLNDGTVQDTRRINWRRVHWEKVERIVVCLKGQDHVIEKHPRAHKFFLYFRQVLDEPARNERGGVLVDVSMGQKKIIRRRRHIWTVGATDGRVCFLIDFDFHSGRRMKEYMRPLSQVMGHVHPRIVALDKLHKSIH